MTSSLGFRQDLTRKKTLKHILFRFFTERWYTCFVPSYFRPVIFKKVKRHRRILGAHRVNGIVDEGSSWSHLLQRMPQHCGRCLVSCDAKQLQLMSSPPPSTSTAPANRHALTAVEKQRSQLERLLKDPAKPAYIPPPPKEKTIRAAREMMKNVQGSSAGAGSGEFHVYKASRRREYERLKLLEEATQKV